MMLEPCKRALTCVTEGLRAWLDELGCELFGIDVHAFFFEALAYEVKCFFCVLDVHFEVAIELDLRKCATDLSMLFQSVLNG